jgi:hypothetical protein
VDTVQNVLKVPNTALRYKPPLPAEDVLALYQQYGIEMNEKSAKEQPASASDSAQGAAALQNGTRPPKIENAVVWKLHADNSMEPIKVSLGITDHAFTEVTAVLKGELKEGEPVIIRSIMPKGSAPGALRR